MPDLPRKRSLLHFSCSLAKKMVVEPFPQERPDVAHKATSGRTIGSLRGRKRGSRTYRHCCCSYHLALVTDLFFFVFENQILSLNRPGVELRYEEYWVMRASWRLGLVRCLLFQSLPILKSTFAVVFSPDLTPWPLSAAWEEGHVGVENSGMNVTHAAGTASFQHRMERRYVIVRSLCYSGNLPYLRILHTQPAGETGRRMGWR